MKPHALATLAIRLAGIYSLTRALPLLPVGLFIVVQGARTGWPLGLYSWSAPMSAVYFLLEAFFLFRYSTRIANLVAPRDDEAAGAALAGPTLQAIGFALVGLLFALSGGKGIVSHLSTARLNDLQSFAIGARRPPLAVPIFQVVSGSALLLGAKDLSRWLARLRSEG